MLVGLAALLGALTVLIPVAVKGYIDIRADFREGARERQELKKEMAVGFQKAAEAQSETKHLVNSHLDHIMNALKEMTAERDTLKAQADKTT